MDREFRIEAFAIASADGFIADAAGRFPDALRNDADRRVYKEAVGRAAALALGRRTYEQDPHTGARRLVLTRRVTALAPDSDDPKVMLWNPAGAPFETAWRAVGLRQGMLAVLGGAEVYAAFLELGCEAFHLAVSHRVRIGAGQTVLPGVGPELSAAEALKRHGLRPGPPRLLDPAAGITLTTWTR